MNRRELEFIVAYVDIYDMMNRPFFEVYDELCEMFDNMPCTRRDYIESFMEKYTPEICHGYLAFEYGF